MRKDDLTSIASEIDRLIYEFLENYNDEDKSDIYNLCRGYVVEEMLRKFQGRINPEVLDIMISMHKKPFDEYGIKRPLI